VPNTTGQNSIRLGAPLTLKGKTLLITGASRGLGRSVAASALRQGGYVIGIGRDEIALEETSVDLSRISSNFHLERLDVTDESALTSFIRDIKQIDVLVNNAGIARSANILDNSTEMIREVFEVNVFAAIVAMRESARKMVQQPDGGIIINIASDAAIKGFKRMTAYVASKHALLGASRCVSLELRQRGVRITTFSPGPISTGIGGGVPSAEALDPEVVADMVVHIAALPKSVEVQELLVEPIMPE
jgi:NAD(P)-dependent dehydrogenase (short-subunit alcohol dehydrogenase family)